MARHNKSMSGNAIEEVLRNTLRVLCCNSVSYESQISIDALIGITVDSAEVILVNIRERLDTSGNSLYTGGSVKSEPVDANVAESAADSSGEVAGFGGGSQPYANVVDVTGYDEEDNELGYDMDSEQYGEGYETDVYFDDGMMQADEGVSAGGFYSEDVKPVPTQAMSEDDTYYMPKTVTTSGSRKKRGSARASVVRGSQYNRAEEYFNPGDGDLSTGGFEGGDVKPFGMQAASDVGRYSGRVLKAVSGPRGRSRRGGLQTSAARGSKSSSFGMPQRKAATPGEMAENLDAVQSRGILANEKTTVFACSICGKMFRHSTSFARHKEAHAGVVFRCDLCGAVLCRRDVLNAHRKKCEAKMMQQGVSEPFDSM